MSKEEKNPYSRNNDEELMLAYQNGDSKAFNELYDRTADRVYGYLNKRLQSRELIDDIFQAIFAKFHQTRFQYRSSLPLLPWLFTICRTVMIDHLRQLERRKENFEDMETYSHSQLAVDSPGELDSSLIFAEGIIGLKTLTSVQKEALSMRFGQDLSFEEIAEKIKTSPSNARQLISRALRKLKSFKKKENEI